MARKVVSRKEKRAEADAAEAAGVKKKKAVKKKVAKKPTKRKSSAKSEVRVKAFWGVFNQSMKRIALYEYADKKKAEKRAKELSESGNKSPHFIQPVTEEVKEEIA